MSTFSKTLLTLSTLSLVPTLAHGRPVGESGGACWMQSGQYSAPMRSNPPLYTCYTTILASSSKASAYADGFSSAGAGSAWDLDIGCEAQVQTAAAVGIYSESYINPCGDGEIEFFGQASISGQTSLIDDDCAGAALGYQQITSNVLTSAIAAVLNASVGETNPGELGGVTGALRGLEVSVPITFGLGEGVYLDNDQDSDSAYSCSDFFTVELKSRAYIKVWANSPLFDLQAAVEAMMSGSAAAFVYLGTCPD